MTTPTTPAPTPSGVGVWSPKIRDQALVRRFAARGGRGYLAVAVTGAGGAAVDADAGTVALKVWFNDASVPEPADVRGVLVLSVDDHTGTQRVQRESVGHYFFDIGPALTQQRGVLTAEWTYRVAGVALAYTDYLQVLDRMPTYEALSDSSRLVVEQVTWLFGDMFDSTEGGPWLQEQFQTHFDYERISQLMSMAATRINFAGVNATAYGVGADNQFPPEWTPLLMWGTYLEVVRHLIRSYTEQPTWVGMNVTYADRRDYSQRWQAILQMEEPQFTKAVIMQKRKMLNLGSSAMLVAGGIYGGAVGGLFRAGMYTAQTRSARFYPAAPSVSWGNLARGG